MMRCPYCGSDDLVDYMVGYKYCDYEERFEIITY